MRKNLVMAILGLAAGSALSTTLGAQAANQGAPQQTANPPAGSYSPRDLSGVWNALRNPYDFSSFSKGDPPIGDFWPAYAVALDWLASEHDGRPAGH